MLAFILKFSIPIFIISFFLSALVRTQVFSHYKKKSSRKRERALLFTMAYLITLLFFLFVPNSFLIKQGLALGVDPNNDPLMANARLAQDWGRNFRPFRTIGAYLKHVQGLHLVTNLLGNVLIFFPLGLALPLLWKKMDRPRAILVFFLALSGIVEFIQYFVGRSVDVDDIILNVLGGLLGFLAYRVLARFFDLGSYQR